MVIGEWGVGEEASTEVVEDGDLGRIREYYEGPRALRDDQGCLAWRGGWICGTQQGLERVET